MGSKALMMTAGAAALCFASATFAGPVLPGFEFSVSVDGIDSGFATPAGADLGGGLFEFAGTFDNGDWNFGQGYNVTVNQATYQLSVAFGFQNNTLEEHTYVVFASAPMFAFASGSQQVATAGISLNDASGDGSGSATNPVGSPAFQGSVDGNALVDLLDPLNLSIGGGGDTASDNTGGLIAGPGALSSDMSIAWSFTLSPGDTVSVTSSYRLFPVPAPSALALLGLAGLAGRRRRRD